LTALFALLAVAGIVLAGCSTDGGSGTAAGTKTVTQTRTPTTAAPTDSATPQATPVPVRVKLFIADGAHFGVGMPIIAFFSQKITNGAALAEATKVTVNGEPIEGGWFFETSAADKDFPVEAHWRPKDYWPAHSAIHMDLPIKGLSGGPVKGQPGKEFVFNNSLTSDFTTGEKNIVTVDDATHKLTVMSDGKLWGTFPVSLGANETPTARGVKVIMEKGESICMSGQPPNGPAYHECGVKWTQRLTYGGEYLHAAPWNTANINAGIDSSNGCTNLHTADAKKLYDFLRIGDVVDFPNANGPRMQLGEGYGDWNVPWSMWQTGGLVPTT
jgi:lipoprotein-anchoring transpeptidase ErfK/SrfK